jgi:hypothetical protein
VATPTGAPSSPRPPLGHPAVCHLAYLAGAVPDVGQSMAELASLTDPGPRPEEGVEAVTTRSDGSIVLTNAAATKASQGSWPRC